MHKSRRNYYSRRSAQTPQPKEEPRGKRDRYNTLETVRRGKKQRIRCITQRQRLKGGRRVRGRPSGGGSGRGRGSSTRRAVELTGEVVTPEGGGTPTPTPGPYERRRSRPRRGRGGKGEWGRGGGAMSRWGGGGAMSRREVRRKRKWETARKRVE